MTPARLIRCALCVAGATALMLSPATEAQVVPTQKQVAPPAAPPAGTVPPASQPATLPATRPGLDAVRLDPRSGDRPRWNQVVSFSVVDGRVSYACDLTVSQTRWLTDDEVEVIGMPGLTTVNIKPRRFYVANSQTGADGQPVVATVTNTRQDGLVLEVVWGEDGRSGLTFQQPGTEYRSYRASGCRLSAYGPGMPNSQVTVEAADFVALRKEFPLETNRFLRPLLHRLGSDLLDVSPAAARQVLFPADDPPAAGDKPTTPNGRPAEAVEAEVRTLLAQLDVPDWARRDAALAGLRRLGPQGAAVLSRMDRGRMSSQQQIGAAVVIRYANPLSADEARKLRDDLHFLADCLYCPEPDVRRAAVDRLATVSKADAAKFQRVAAADPAKDFSAALAAIEDLRQQLAPPPPPAKQP
ncbi:MAG TPA: hypothetical protein VF796_24495 [Humisphaera sp.]